MLNKINFREEIDETLRMELVLLDRLSEKLATRDTEWASIRMSNIDIFYAWSRNINDQKWKE